MHERHHKHHHKNQELQSQEKRQFRRQFRKCIKKVISEAKNLEVLKNLLYYSKNNALSQLFQKLSGEGEIITRESLIRCLHQNKSNKRAAKSNEIFDFLFQDFDQVDQERFYEIFRPEIIIKKRIEEQHDVNVKNMEQHLLILYAMSLTKKFKAKEEFIDLFKVKKNFRIFKELAKIGTDNILHIKKMLKVLEILKFQFSRLQFQLFMRQFFNNQESLDIQEFCTLEFLEEDVSNRESVSNVVASQLEKNQQQQLQQHQRHQGQQQGLSEQQQQHNEQQQDQHTTVSEPTLDLFYSYFQVQMKYGSDLRLRQQKFREIYSFELFRERIMALHTASLKNIDPRFTQDFTRTEIYLNYINMKMDLDLKEFVHILSELKLTNISNKSARVFFSKIEQHGVLTLKRFYEFLSQPEEDIQILEDVDRHLQLLLELLLIVEEKLEDIRQRIGNKINNELIEIFNLVDKDNSGVIHIDDLCQFFKSQNRHFQEEMFSDICWDIFKSEQITLRNFLNEFLPIQ